MNERLGNNRLVFVWLMGGLGNVLFQVNFGMYLEQRGYKVQFVENLTHTNWVTKILGWKIHDVVYPSLISAEFTQQRWTPLLLAKSGLMKKFAQYYGKGHLPERPALHTFGYFQEKALLRKILITIKDPRIVQREAVNPVIHLRLTDSNYGSENINNLLHLKNLMPNQRFTIVTDDPLKTQELIRDIKLDAAIRHGDVLSDFYFLTSAKKLLLADSTFSWWAAALSENLNDVWIPNRLFQELGFPQSFQVTQKISGLVQLKRTMR